MLMPANAPLLVCVSAQSDRHRLACDSVELLRAIARRPHTFDSRAKGSVDGDGATGPDGYLRLFGQLRIRTYAYPEDHDVGVQGSLVGDHRLDPALGHPETRDRFTHKQVDPHVPHPVGHDLAHVRIDGRHRLRRLIDQGDVHAQVDECLRHLEPDVSASDDHGVAALDSLGPLLDRAAVIERLDSEDAFGVDAIQWRADRLGPCCNHELVEALRQFAPPVQILNVNLASLEIYPGDLVADANIDPPLAVLIG